MSESDTVVTIVALRNEKGSYNNTCKACQRRFIVALRNEKGSYNFKALPIIYASIVALRNEKGSYNRGKLLKQNQ